MKVKGLRWWIIGLIGLATIINYIDRSAINIMWPYIYKEFGIKDIDSDKALATMNIFFLAAYACGQTITGKMMDAIGTRIGMVISIAGWSISIALHSVARSMMSFNIFRSMLGVSEAGNWPGATKSNAEWFPPKERAVAQGIFGASASIGSVVALPLIALVFTKFGWRGTFIGIAGLGLLWVIPWLLINKNAPDKHPWIKKEELDHIKSGTEKNTVDADEKALSWRILLSFRNTWGIITSRFFIDPVWWMFVVWLPTFLKKQYAFDIKQVGAFGWVPYLFAAIGAIAGGFYSSRMVKKGMAPARARKNAITIGCLFMLIALGLTAFYLEQLKDHVNLTIALISAILFGFQFLINNLQTLPADYFSGKNVGAVSGMGGTAAVLGTIMLMYVTPGIAKSGYALLFAIAAALVPIAWLCITFITSKRAANSMDQLP
jgi:ACS family hexuronate transporter-like MFS transporter